MYDDLTLEQLQTLAASRGLPVEGDEEDLIAALEGYDTNEEDRTEAPPTTFDDVEYGADGVNYASVQNPPVKAIVREG